MLKALSADEWRYLIGAYAFDPMQVPSIRCSSRSKAVITLKFQLTKELSAKHASGEALSMEASRKFSRTPPRLLPCSDVSAVLQKTRMSHFWDTHHSVVIIPACNGSTFYLFRVAQHGRRRRDSGTAHSSLFYLRTLLITGRKTESRHFNKADDVKELLGQRKPGPLPRTGVATHAPLRGGMGTPDNGKARGFSCRRGWTRHRIPRGRPAATGSLRAAALKPPRNRCRGRASP